VGHGNALNNRIVGSEFANTLNGWNGNDTLVCGAGQDVFVFTRGQDVVQDFADNVDTIAIHRALWQGTANSVQAVLDLFRDTAAGLSIDFGNGNRLVLAGVHDIEALRDDILLL
jgi:serralysin